MYEEEYLDVEQNRVKKAILKVKRILQQAEDIYSILVEHLEVSLVSYYSLKLINHLETYTTV